MKRKSLLFLLLFALLAPWVANAQTTVTIGEGTATSNTNPIGTYYNYSITEQLYTADEIGMAGTISSISFYYMGIAAKDLPITVYMANVDAEDLTSGISLADANEVFSGTLSVTTTAGWVTIDLDTPFAYDGTSNLLIGIIKDYLYYFSGQSWQGTSVSNMARYTQSDSAGPYTTGTVPGSAASVRPNIQIAITAGSGPVCEKPETMEASNVTTNSATLNWTGGSGTYNVEYMGGTVTEWTSYLTNTTATTANLTGLTPGTNYQYRVQSVCTDGVSGWKSVSFMTMFGIPFVEEFGTAIPTGWSMYTGLLGGVLADTLELAAATYGWNFGQNAGVFDNHAYVNIYGTGCNRWLVMPTVTMEDNVQLMFDVAYTAYTYGTTAPGNPAQTGTDDMFVVLINNGRSWEIVRQWDNARSEYVLNDLTPTPLTVAIDLSSYVEAGQPLTVAFYVESTEYNADNNLHIDNVNFDYIPDCAKPTNLAVNYEGGTEATISWMSDATAWNMRVNGVDVNGTITNPYTLTGLELATTYEVEVQANCGDATSDWAGPVSFKTDNCMPEDMCALTFTVTDSYGDGWNGASIDIYDYTGSEVGDLLASITNENLDGQSGSGGAYAETQTITLNFCDGQELAIIWMEGDYDDECSYTITDINGDIVAQDDMELAIAYTIDCTVTDCRKPTDLAASEIGNHSVKLSWTENGPATAWVVSYTTDGENFTEVNAPTNPFTLTGLTPETMYGVIVTPVCEVDKPSDMVVFTTDVACPKPSDLSVTPYPFTADVTWNGFAEAYDIEWAQPVESTSSAWLQYDDGTLASNVGNSTANTWTWGVMYPAEMLEGNTLTKIAFYEVGNSYYTDGTVTLNVYSGGDAAPETLIGTKTIATEGTNGMREVVIDPIEFDASQNLWITLTTNATYCMAMSAEDGGANSRWFLNGSNWVDFGTLYTAGAAYSYMIRGFIETTNYSAWNWSSESGITSPYTITGLEAETDYAVRVKAVCGGEDGESLWTWAYFTTPTACDAPVELEATDITYNAATLNWVGYQDSYNLRYREAAKYVAVWEDDFENGLDQWTLVQGASATGSNWYTIDLTTALDDVDALSGTHCASSWSWSTYAYQTDNWLITPQLDLQGVVKYYVRTNMGYPDHYEVLLSTTDADTTNFTVTLQEMATAPATEEWNEVVIDLSAYAGQQGYIAIHHVDYDANFLLIEDFGIYNVVEASDWNNVVTTEATYNVTGLTPETDYEWQVQGVNSSCDGGLTEWTEIQNFTTLEKTTETQEVELTAGLNWFSSYVEITLSELQAAFQEALGTTVSATLMSENGNIRYIRGRWGAAPAGFVWDAALMYVFDVSADCEFAIEGMAIVPSEHPITVKPGTNWIGYPFSTSKTLTEAYAGFAVNGDEIKSQTSNNRYIRNRWSNSGLTTLEPGQGYKYTSSEAADRELVYPSAAKSAKAGVKPGKTEVKVLVKGESPKTMDVEIGRVAPSKSVKDVFRFGFKK